MFTKKLCIDDVFKARSKFDIGKYIVRKKLELEYEDAIKSDLCILIRGNSGVGKTWLTYKMMIQTESHYKIINLALIKSHQTFDNYFKNNIPNLLIKQTNTKKANANALVATGELSTTTEYIPSHNYFIEFLKAIKSDYIIFENFESILGETELIKELGCLITLMDDNIVKKYGTKFIIIGTNTDIQRFFSSLPNSDTIDNRIRELSEIKGFSELECFSFVINGFKKLDIKIPLTEESNINKKIYKLTCGIPQRLHELCRIISQIHINNENYNFSYDYVEEAKKMWLVTSFSKNYALLSEMYRNNLRENKNNNYILFIIAEQDSLQFDYLKIHANISEYFPTKNIGKIVVKNYLKKLADTSKNNNILVSHDNDFYSIRDYKTILCLRSMLYLDEDNVKIYDIQEL